MRNIKLTLEYDGTHFEGWQVQKKGHRTVQGEIERALFKIFKKKIRVIGAGRTDSGVHALGQVANFLVNSRLTVEEIQRALNAHLPPDIVVLRAQLASERFHAQYSVESKTYRYTILNRPERSSQLRGFCLHDALSLNIMRMRQEAKSLLGRHDFRSFAGSNPSKEERQKPRTTIRTIFRIDIKRMADFVTIDVEADGFLYKMMRRIMGTLLEIGHDRLPKGSTKKILEKKSLAAPVRTAPPHGLCLVEVKY